MMDSISPQPPPQCTGVYHTNYYYPNSGGQASSWGPQYYTFPQGTDPAYGCPTQGSVLTGQPVQIIIPRPPPPPPPPCSPAPPPPPPPSPYSPNVIVVQQVPATSRLTSHYFWRRAKVLMLVSLAVSILGCCLPLSYSAIIYSHLAAECCKRNKATSRLTSHYFWRRPRVLMLVSLAVSILGCCWPLSNSAIIYSYLAAECCKRNNFLWAEHFTRWAMNFNIIAVTFGVTVYFTKLLICELGYLGP